MQVNSDKEYYRASKGGRWPIKWYAPECVNYGTFSHASDVWSYGVLLWEMYTFGKQPYDGMRGDEVVQIVESGKYLTHKMYFPQFYSLYFLCSKSVIIGYTRCIAIHQYFRTV